MREGESSPEPLGSESELSEWSDADDDQDIRDKIVINNQVDSENNSSRADSDAIKKSDALSWISENIQFPYWQKSQVVNVTSEENCAKIADICERQLEDDGHVGVRSNKMTECQVIREVLWMLRHPVASPLFRIVDGHFVVNFGVTIPSLTQPALEKMLGDFVLCINDANVLRTFTNEIKEEQSPMTFEAYGESINLFLDEFSGKIIEIEKSVLKQRETVTILSVVDDLRPWFQKLKYLTTLHQSATNNWKDSDNWLKSIRLLSVLYNGISSNHLAGLHSFIVDAFLRSFRPYLNIIHIWLEEGRLEVIQIKAI